jgi:type IV pilus assembly protein PilA
MFLQNLRARLGARLSGDGEAGFTLIELLVVMLILGILAAIALPAFFNQREKAGDAKAKENAHTAQVAVETYATENGGSYTGVTLTKLHAIEPTISETAGAEATTGTNATAAKEGLIVSTSASNKYLIKSVSSTGNVFKIENNAGELKFMCTTAGKGGCPAAASGETEGNWSK